MKVLVGTASWTDKTLLACGRFYPRTATTAEARLRFYASQFPLVEVDSSYYAMPAPNVAALWAERTPRGFTMNVKAFRLFTGHATEAKVLPRDIQAALGADSRLHYATTPPEIRDELWRRFHEALAPLRHAGRLGLVHFQFPPSLRPDAEGLAHLAHCVDRMAGLRVSIEFRHASWFSGSRAEQTLALQRELGVVHTVVDAPQGFANSVPAIWEATVDDMALVRLHGRNARTWNIRGATSASDRFNYDYPDSELADLAQRIRGLAARVGTTHVIFNNNMEDQGQRNARSLMALLESKPA